jgi:hypothetical protein
MHFVHAFARGQAAIKNHGAHGFRSHFTDIASIRT